MAFPFGAQCGDRDKHSAKKHSVAPEAAQDFKVSQVAALRGASATGQTTRLDLRANMDTAEELTVYGVRRHRSEGPDAAPALLTLGPATLAGSAETDLPSFRGLRMSASVPIPGVAGLGAVANLSAGHDQVNTGTTVTSVAATAGLKLDF